MGNLHITDYPLPWEDPSFLYPDNLASPLSIIIEASNGASDYGNKFGEPLINGFTRSYGMRHPVTGERSEYVKPIMFSGGMGMIEHRHSFKKEPEVGHVVVKVGGPAYRIGLGGGAASSMAQGDNRSDLDFNAVQRGDAEMEQKVYRVLRSCVELGADNPIISIHDQGAGGNCNVVKELVYPAGGTINLREVWIGDESLSALEIWGAEYQEQFGLLLSEDSIPLFRSLCERENVVMSVIGKVDGSGRIVVVDPLQEDTVVDLDLEKVLGDLPQKTFTDSREDRIAKSRAFDLRVSVRDALDRVLRLLSVCSKRFLTTKVDRSVTGLVARQQCVGPLHLPLSDSAVVAHSHFDLRGSATAIGERPNLSLINPAAMARMTVGEMLSNLASAHITALADTKCEGNWMWAAKLENECAAIYESATALRDILIELEVAIDGGKDSVSMAAKCPDLGGSIETVKAPGTLVMTGYCTCPDIRHVWTPDIKRPGSSVVLHVDLARGKRRLGGSALFQVFGELGNETPDVDDTLLLRTGFNIIQSLHGTDSPVLSYHDISDGGILTSLLEMGFAGNCGLSITLDSSATKKVGLLAGLFAEEIGAMLEVALDDVDSVIARFEGEGVPCFEVARTRCDDVLEVACDGDIVFSSDIRELRDVWEDTSFRLELRQANPACIVQEQRSLYSQRGFNYFASFLPRKTDPEIMSNKEKPRVAIIREEGSNGDREMAAAFHMAGFDAWDVSTRDIAMGTIDLKEFKGAAFVGGFSYADVLDSAKGWAGVILHQPKVRSSLEEFFRRYVVPCISPSSADLTLLDLPVALKERHILARGLQWLPVAKFAGSCTQW